MISFVRLLGSIHPLGQRLIRTVLVDGGKHLLPELGEQLGGYAENKLSERGVVVMKGARVTSYDGSVVKLNNGTSISAATLIWTAERNPVR